MSEAQKRVSVLSSEDGNTLIFKVPGEDRAVAILTIIQSEFNLKFFKQVDEEVKRQIVRWSKRYMNKRLFGGRKT